MATPQDVMKMVKENDAKFVDFRFYRHPWQGTARHRAGLRFRRRQVRKRPRLDGSSIAGWKGIQASDMLLMPDPSTAYCRPFFDETTVVLTCDVVDPPTAAATTATRVPSPSAPRPT